jgi:hypothetical protein
MATDYDRAILFNAGEYNFYIRRCAEKMANGKLHAACILLDKAAYHEQRMETLLAEQAAAVAACDREPM